MNINSTKRILMSALLFCSISTTSLIHSAIETKVGNFVVYPGATTNLNILRDNSYDCDRADITITIVTPPTNGTLVVQANNTVSYTPSIALGDQLVNDVFSYTMTCDGETSAVTKVFIYPGFKPDNMIDNICHVDPTGFEWKIGAPKSSTESIVVSRPWMVGDLDGNGLPEIVAHADFINTPRPDLFPASPNANIEQNRKIAIFKDGDVTNPDYIDIDATAGTSNAYYCEYFAIGAIGVSKFIDGEGAIVTAGVDGRLYAYDYPSKTLRYTSTELYDQIQRNDGLDRRRSGPSIGFADFDGDGMVEMYVGNKIFSLDGLQLLAKLPNGSNFGKNIQNADAVNNEYGGSVSLAADLDNDGYPELIVGNEAYKVEHDGMGNWTMSLYKRITPPTLSIFGRNTTIMNDGFTSVVDLNGDGYLDVIVTKIGYVPLTVSGRATRRPYLAIYGWNVRTNTIMFRTVIQDRSNTSYPLIGDVDGDGKLEIACTQQVTNTNPNTAGFYPELARGNSYVKGYKFPTTFGPNASLTETWSLQVDETATRTGISLFDFNLDGRMELIYRDMSKLRIMQANTSGGFSDLATISSISATTFEMAMVADVDGDGAAEIICGSATAPSTVLGTMQVFKSGNQYNWAPARKVWNQFAYNPTFVNEDLTIPERLFNPSTGFTDDHGVVRHPFNNMLQQAPIMNMEGISLNPAPNLLVDPASTVRLSYTDATDKLTVSGVIMNDGNIAFRGPIALQLYAYTDATASYTPVGPQFLHGTAASSLAQNASISVSYDISNFMTITAGLVPNRWYLAINTKDDSPHAPLYFYSQAECKSGDNLTYRISFVEKEAVMCEGDSEILELSDIYSYRWYAQKTDVTPLPTAGSDNKMNVTKNNAPVQYLFVETYRKGDFVRPITSIRDTIFIYKTPPTLVWTGEDKTGDWHNFKNWSNPEDIFNKYPRANIPRACTNVIIPDGISIYPGLSALTTNYADYVNPECDTITIHHGGEVTLPTRLHYQKAKVDINMSVNRWYMFSPPLKDFNTGDIYVNDPNPYLDDAIMSVRRFGLKNPQNGYVSAGWSGKFNKPTVTFNAGEGLAIWVNDGNTTPAARTKYLFEYPKYDTQYHIYGTSAGDIWGTYPVASRVNANRFIFDGLPNASGNFTVSTLDDNGNGLPAKKLWLVGNPFMAHLDFNKFYQANQTKIKNYYRIMTDGGVYEFYNQGANTLPQYIAPMQSFIIEVADGVASPVSSLTFNGSMTLNVPGETNKIRSASDGSTITQKGRLSIALTDDTFKNHYSQIFVVAENGASNAYVGSEDVTLLLNTYTDFTIEPSVLFTRSTDDQYLSVNRVNAQGLDQLDIPIGIRSVKDNQKLNFLIQGQPTFVDNLDLKLYDKLEDKHYDLKNGATWYSFTNETAKDFLIDRFVIQIGTRKASGIEDNVVDGDQSISIITDKKSYNIVSSEALLKSIQVFDLQGRTVSSTESINSSTYTGSISQEGVYVIKITTDNNTVSRKVIIK